MLKLSWLIFQLITQVAPTLEYNLNYTQGSVVFNIEKFNYTYPRTIRVKYLRILLGSIGEEDFYICCMFKLSFTIIFVDNVNDATI